VGHLALPEELRAQAVSLRPERSDDAAFMDRLYVSTRWEEMTVTGWPDDQKLAFLHQQRQYQASHYATHYHDAQFDVVEVAGVPAGRLYLLRLPNDYRIVDISLLPEYRNRGIGGALMRSVAEEAHAKGIKVSIHVEVVNPAQTLYRRLGFVECENKGAYLLMEWPPRSPSPP